MEAEIWTMHTCFFRMFATHLHAQSVLINKICRHRSSVGSSLRVRCWLGKIYCTAPLPPCPPCRHLGDGLLRRLRGDGQVPVLLPLWVPVVVAFHFIPVMVVRAVLSRENENRF